MSFIVGCAGWSYRDWVPAVYPPRSNPDQWLGMYAGLFDTVEVNSTFYALPEERTVRGWVEQTRSRDGFTFSAKVPQAATHHALPRRDVDEARREARAFLERVVHPLEAAGRFGAAVVQLPPTLRSGEASLDDLLGLVGTLQPHRRRVAVEFRHRSWFPGPGERLNPDAEDALGDLGAAVARIDGLGSTFTASRTTPWSYHRLHGRRKVIPADERGERWAPYNYLYTRDEIAEIAAAVQDYAAADEHTIVVFNNHYQGKACTNAADLLEALGSRRPVLPATTEATRRLDDFIG